MTATRLLDRIEGVTGLGRRCMPVTRATVTLTVTEIFVLQEALSLSELTSAISSMLRRTRILERNYSHRLPMDSSATFILISPRFYKCNDRDFDSFRSALLVS
jgi:hypothetical protein